MDILKKGFPLSWRAEEKNTRSLVVSILLYVVVILGYTVCAGILGMWLGKLIAWLLGLLGTAVGLYSTMGIVLAILRYCGILK